MSKMIRQLLPFGTLMLIICMLSALRPDTFLTIDNFLNVFRRSSVNGIMAVGMTAIIITAGIDLSVGSMLAFSGMIGAWTMLAVGGPQASGMALVIGTGAGIVVGVLCGFTNGMLITKLKLPPFIVTLGTMSAFRGAAYVINDGKPYNVPEYTYLGNGLVVFWKTVETVTYKGGEAVRNVLDVAMPWASSEKLAESFTSEGAKVVPHGIPISIIIFITIVVVAAYILKYTRLGRYTYAIGSNKEAAFHAGVNVDRNLIWIYMLTGLVVGIAAMIATSRTVSAQPTAAIALELDIIAAVVIGGTSLSGGRGTITGTIIGTLLISFLRNGCTLLGISTNVQLIVIGIIIIVACAIDQVARSKAKTTS